MRAVGRENSCRHHIAHGGHRTVFRRAARRHEATLDRQRRTGVLWSLQRVSAQRLRQVVRTRVFRYRFCTKIYTTEALAEETDSLLECHTPIVQHCIYFLFPYGKSNSYCPRKRKPKEHVSSSCNELFRTTFIPRRLL